jgi:uncharacterized protein YdhG (YjbR/CyaY superfamily)
MSDIDTYISSAAAGQRDELERIRAVVKSQVPEAEEAISYGMPTFKYKGKNLIHFAAFKDHLSIFPTADPTIDTELGEKLKKFRTGKGTLQFTEDNPISDDLIAKIVAIRLQSISGK